MAKKTDTQLTEEQIKDKPAKQSFVKITKNKNKNPRTWVVIYRLVDGPPVDPEKSRARKAARKKKASASE